MKLKQLKEDAFSDELLLDIDFSEFDKVIGFQASKDEDEKEINDTDSGVVVDFEDIDDDPMYDDIEDIQEENTQEEETQNKVNNCNNQVSLKIFIVVTGSCLCCHEQLLDSNNIKYRSHL